MLRLAVGRTNQSRKTFAVAKLAGAGWALCWPTVIVSSSQDQYSPVRVLFSSFIVSNGPGVAQDHRIPTTELWHVGDVADHGFPCEESRKIASCIEYIAAMSGGHLGLGLAEQLRQPRLSMVG